MSKLSFSTTSKTLKILHRPFFYVVLLFLINIAYIVIYRPLFDFPLPSQSRLFSKAKPNAVIVMLCRNSDLRHVKKSLRKFENRFNEKHGYPYVFLNEEPFDEFFKDTITTFTKNPVSFGLIDKEKEWSIPSFLDEKTVIEAGKKMASEGVKFGDMLSYHHMCRYNSGFFFNHPLLKDYDWYWRVEPDVHFTTDIPNDPFVFLRDNKKEYGFTIMTSETMNSIPSLWKITKQFIKEHPHLIPKDNSLSMLEIPVYQNQNGQDYNGCHFWSNFEIGNLNFFRSKAYMAYFDYLDKTGNFFLERWGDAPVHSIALAMLLPASKLHWFKEIGYIHHPYQNCPDLQGARCRRENSHELMNPCINSFLSYQRLL